MIQAWFWISALLSGLGSKLGSLKRARRQPPTRAFVLGSPVLSTDSWEKKTRFERRMVARLCLQSLLLFLGFVATRWLYFKWLTPLRPSAILQGYAAVLPLYLFGQFVSTMIELVYLPSGWLFPAHFRFPPLAGNLTEFWGQRWASWVADAFRQMVFRRFPRQPERGLFAVFLLSGLWHEWLINLPLALFYRVNLLGSMVLYFALQALGIWAERKLGLSTPLIRRIYTWLVVLLPVPLVVNQGTLRIFRLFIQ